MKILTARLDFYTFSFYLIFVGLSSASGNPHQMYVEPAGPILVSEGGTISWKCKISKAVLITNTVVHPPAAAVHNRKPSFDSESVEENHSENILRVTVRHARRLDSGTYICETHDKRTSKPYTAQISVRVIKGEAGEFCKDSEFRCGQGTGECINRGYLCNGANDCEDGSDEQNCKDRACEGSFRCRSGGCVSRDLVCDSNTQCTDGSDELGCPGSDSDVNGAALPWLVYVALGGVAVLAVLVVVILFHYLRLRKRRAGERRRTNLGPNAGGSGDQDEVNPLVNVLSHQEVVVREDGSIEILDKPPPYEEHGEPPRQAPSYSETLQTSSSQVEPSAPPISNNNSITIPELPPYPIDPPPSEAPPLPLPPAKQEPSPDEPPEMNGEFRVVTAERVDI